MRVLLVGLAVALCAPLAANAQPVTLLGSHLMKMVDDTIEPIVPGKRKFNWRVRSGQAAIENQVVVPLPGSAGDPTIHGGTFTVYNSAGSGESFTVDLPAENWVMTGLPENPGGHRYIYASSTPIHKVWVKALKLTLKGGKSAWGYSLDEPSQGSLAVQLTLGTGITWCTEAFPATSGTPPSSAKFDKQNKFRAQRLGPPPTSCPPLPTP